MTISDFFTTRDHIKEDVEFRIRVNKTSGKISGGSVHPELCDSEGENVLRRQLPLSIFTVSAGEKSTLETFLVKLIDEALADTGFSVFVPPPPE